MGVIVPVGECQVILKWTTLGDLETMVSTFGISGLGAYADETAAAASIEALAVAQVTGAAKMSSQYTWKGVEVARKQDDGTFVRGFSDVSVTGTGSWLPVPNNTALLVTKRTLSGGKKGRGRMFVPPFRTGEDQVNGYGVITSSVVTSMQTEWTAFFNGLNNALSTDEMVLFHSDGSPSTPVASLKVEQQMATQRTRMRR